MKRGYFPVIPLAIYSALFLLNPMSTPVFAQEVFQSNVVCTKVGNPTDKEPPICLGGDLVKAAGDVVNAYRQQCGSSHAFATVTASCLRGYLQGQGYSDAPLNAFESRRQASLVGDPLCSQCVGFVSTSLALITSADNCMEGSASAFYNKSFIACGGQTYQLVNGPPQRGDIGIAGANSRYGSGEWHTADGHALIVNQVIDPIKFTAYESNFKGPGQDYCSVTDGQTHFAPIYHFFRKT